VINWILEVEDVEDVDCTVDDMEATERSGSLVRRGWNKGRGDKGTVESLSSVQAGVRLWRPHEAVTRVTGPVGVYFN
jgi:hypothetical protein